MDRATFSPITLWRSAGGTCPGGASALGRILSLPHDRRQPAARLCLGHGSADATHHGTPAGHSATRPEFNIFAGHQNNSSILREHGGACGAWAGRARRLFRRGPTASTALGVRRLATLPC